MEVEVEGPYEVLKHVRWVAVSWNRRIYRVSRNEQTFESRVFFICRSLVEKYLEKYQSRIETTPLKLAIRHLNRFTKSPRV